MQMSDPEDLAPPPGTPRRRGRRAATITDVAVAAGVGRGTVSRVLNGGRWVSAEAQALVNRAVAETGYVVNHSARSLATGRSGAVAMVITEPAEKLFEDPTFSVLVRELTRALRPHGLALFLSLVDDAADREGLMRQVRSGFLDGVVLFSTHGDDPLFADLVAADAAAVLCGGAIGAGAKLAHAEADNADGAAQLCRHLRERGYSRIGLVTGPLDTTGARERQAGYRLVTGEAADSARMQEASEYSAAAGAIAMRELLARCPDLDAVFIASDLLASGALGVLRAAGLRPGSDIAVGGFDDSVLAHSAEPPLTTVALPFTGLAEALVELLVLRIDGGPPESRLLPTRLVVRQSTPPVAG